MRSKTPPPTPVWSLSKKIVIVFLKFLGKLYYFSLRFLLITSGKFNSFGASIMPCPVCGKLPGEPPRLQARANDPRIYDSRAWALNLYNLKAISRVRSIYGYVSGERSNASKFLKLNYFECQDCKSLFKSGAHFWRLKFETNPKFYSTIYRNGKIYGRPVLMKSPRIINWSRYITSFFPNPSSIKILDMGCAEGYLVLALRNDEFQAYGIEPNLQMCAYATQIIGISNENITHSSYEIESYGAESFDAISSYHTIEHCPSPEYILRSAYNHLKKGGLLFLSTPSAEISLREFEIAGRNLNFVDTHDFILSEQAIETLALEVGLLVIRRNTFNNIDSEFGIDVLGEKEGGVNYVFLKP